MRACRACRQPAKSMNPKGSRRSNIGCVRPYWCTETMHDKPYMVEAPQEQGCVVSCVRPNSRTPSRECDAADDAAEAQ